MDLTLIQKICVWALPIIFAITLHEVAHGWVASWFGDQTARLSGRLTLNPVKHIDIIGTIIVPLLMLIAGGILFGWAKPVPVDPRNMGHPRRDMAIVALAGPLSNLLMALIWAMIAKIGLQFGSLGLVYMGEAGVTINIALGVLNLLPLPPLDGGKILQSIVSPRLAYTISKIEPYSFFILIALIFTGILSFIIIPPIYFLIGLISSVVGLG